MCFFAREQEPKIAQTDILCYKIGYYERHGKDTFSPYFKPFFYYKKGIKTEKIELVVIPDERVEGFINIEAGYHSCKSPKEAKALKVETQEGVDLASFTIPQGTLYYDGINGYVSQTLIFNEVIGW